jgi:hypothetical protein
MLAGRVNDILQSDKLQAELGRRAREHVETCCDWLVQAGKLIEIYKQVIHESS